MCAALSFYWFQRADKFFPCEKQQKCDQGRNGERENEKKEKRKNAGLTPEVRKTTIPTFLHPVWITIIPVRALSIVAENYFIIVRSVGRLECPREAFLRFRDLFILEKKEKVWPLKKRKKKIG